MKISVAIAVLGALCPTIWAAPKPVIFDTDYGPFIDDIFALGLILNSGDLLDLQYVIATSEQPDLSAQCITKHIDLAGSTVPVGQGAAFPDYSERGGVCAVPGWVGFALEAECQNVTLPFDADGISSMAQLLMDSDRDDWMYIVVGGQTSLMALLSEYPEAASKLQTLIVMGGNWCADFEPYPDVLAPTDETNIACDPGAANFVLDERNSDFDSIYYIPVAVADEIGGSDYIKIVQAANGTDAGAAAILQFYRTWSAAARADEDLLVHLEALTYDPETESTPQFDACAVMAGIELLDGKDDRLVFREIPAVHFYEVSDSGLAAFPDGPRSAFSLLPESFTEDVTLPDQCPNVTEYRFNLTETPEQESPVIVALGFSSEAAKASFYAEMAERMAGIYVADTGTEPGASSVLSSWVGAWWTIAMVAIALLL